MFALEDFELRKYFFECLSVFDLIFTIEKGKRLVVVVKRNDYEKGIGLKLQIYFFKLTRVWLYILNFWTLIKYLYNIYLSILTFMSNCILWFEITK